MSCKAEVNNLVYSSPTTAILVAGQSDHFIGYVWCNSLFSRYILQILTNFKGSGRHLHQEHKAFATLQQISAPTNTGFPN